MPDVGVAIIGTGSIALANHLPGLALTRAKVVTLCDSNTTVLEAAAKRTGVNETFTNYHQAISHPGVDAVIIATPNLMHAPIALAAIGAGKHVLCEKPLALNYATALKMLRAAETANVRHMTAFTYRFVPAMRYTAHLIHRGDIGRPLHFRAQRFQDWGERNLGWRQKKEFAGTGELGDMLSHRIDFSLMLLGAIDQLVADLRQFIPSRGGHVSDVDDFVSMLADFRSGATGVFESTKLAIGYGEGYGGRDVVEINGTDASIVYSTQSPLQLKIARRGEQELRMIDVPREFLVYPGSPRDPSQGDPRVTFRYDQDVEFVDAILERRDCRPSFREGVETQAVIDAAVISSHERRWVDMRDITNQESAR
jgi:predicted dehydrogenase